MNLKESYNYVFNYVFLSYFEKNFWNILLLLNLLFKIYDLA